MQSKKRKISNAVLHTQMENLCECIREANYGYARQTALVILERCNEYKLFETENDYRKLLFTVNGIIDYIKKGRKGSEPITLASIENRLREAVENLDY